MLDLFVKRFLVLSVICVSEEEKPKNVPTEEVTQLKMEAEQRKKEVEDLAAALEKKQTEAEERLKETEQRDKEVKGLQDALDHKKTELQGMKKELDEVNQLVEEKSREADESMEKYCSLLIKVHKLEESNEGLKIRLEQLNATRRANEANINDTRRRSSRKSSTKRQEVEKDDNTENLVPSAAQGASPGKRGHGEVSDKDSAQEVLHNLTKKLKASAMTTPKTRGGQEEEDFRPEGLPELVQRGV